MITWDSTSDKEDGTDKYVYKIHKYLYIGCVCVVLGVIFVVLGTIL